MTQIWIMTIPIWELNKRELLFRLRRRAKRWQFGIEVGSHSGYEHYQVRYECSNGDISRERGYWGDISCELQQGGGWSEYERKDGNFYTSDDVRMGKYRFRELKELQLYILSLGRLEGERGITLIVDKIGGIGKTFLGRWADLNGYGTYIDGSTDIETINRDIYDISETRQINRLFIDLTRNTKFTGNLWSGIESIKNGYLVDRRYGYRSKWICPPEIYIFANHEPASWDGLSDDRWQRLFIERKKITAPVLTRFYPEIGNPELMVKREFTS